MQDNDEQATFYISSMQGSEQHSVVVLKNAVVENHGSTVPSLCGRYLAGWFSKAVLLLPGEFANTQLCSKLSRD